MRRLEEQKRILMLVYGTRNGGWLVECVRKPEVRGPWYPVHLEEPLTEQLVIEGCGWIFLVIV